MTPIPLGRDGALTVASVLVLAAIACSAGCTSVPRNEVSEAPAPQTAPAPVPPPAEKPMVEHTVVQGDSLWKLAMDYDTTVAEIKQANNLETDLIKTGKTLRIPTFKAPTVGAATAGVTGSVTPGQGTQPIEGAPSSPPSLTLGEAPPSPGRSSIPDDIPYFRDGSRATVADPVNPSSEINVPSIVPQ